MGQRLTSRSAALATAISTVFLASPISAAPPTAETGGLRLNMSPTEARAALVELNPGFRISEKKARLPNGPSFVYQYTGFFEASKSGPGMAEGYGEIVHVMLSPFPEEERVQEIHREMRFRTQIEPNEPLIDEFVAGMKAKYGSQTSLETRGFLLWLFDTQGNLLPLSASIMNQATSNPKVACSLTASNLTNSALGSVGYGNPNWPAATFSTPQFNRGSCGISIAIGFSASSRNPSLLSSFSIDIVDVTAVESDFKRANDRARSQASKEQQEQVDQARRNPPVRY